MLKQIKKAGFILKPNSPEIRDTYIGIKKLFNKRGIEVVLDNRSASMISKSGIKFKKMCKEVDFLVSLGGDGTLLSLVRRSYGYNKPVLGINAGNLGFLADVKLDEVDEFLDNLLKGNYRIDDRMMMSAKLHKSNFTEQFYAFNDIVITRPTISKMVKVDAYIDEENFNTYRGDGLIVSTPTGSTAYSQVWGTTLKLDCGGGEGIMHTVPAKGFLTTATRIQGSTVTYFVNGLPILTESCNPMTTPMDHMEFIYAYHNGIDELNMWNTNNSEMEHNLFWCIIITHLFCIYCEVNINKC